MKPTAKTIAATMTESVIASIRSTLKQKGLQGAREQWQVLNNTLSGEDWWPPVVRSVRQLLDDYVDEQKRQEQEARQGESQSKNIYFINDNSQTGHNQWNAPVGQVLEHVERVENTPVQKHYNYG